MTIYGIPNCDTIKKATDWLKTNSVDYQLHDYRKEEIPSQTLKSWFKQVGLNTIVNQRSTTWKELTDDEREKALSESTAIEVIHNHPTLIKRPVLEKEGKVLAVGFKESEYEKLFG